MAVSMLDNFDIRKSAPNVKRDMFDTIADMAAYNENYLPQVFITTNVEDGCIYVFNKGNDMDPVTGKWRKFEGGATDLVNYYNKLQVDGLLNDKVDKETGKGLSSNDYTSEEKTKLASLENYDDTALAARVSANEDAIEVLNGDATVNGSVAKAVDDCFSDSKDYTDVAIQNAIRQTAIVCDAKPTISGTTITYVQGGVSNTVTSDNKTKFYYSDNGTNYSTIWIEGTEFTDTIASVDFSDYISKTNDVVNTYTGSEANKAKIPNLGAMDALKALIDTALAEKLDIADILDAISSSSDNPVASSVLFTEFAKKVDIEQGVANEGKVLQVNDEGNLVLVDPSAMDSDAADVSYDNENFPALNNVEKALDNILAKLYYVDPEISTFTSTPSTLQYENGEVVTGGVVFNWTYNKDMTTQTLTDCTLADETVRTATYSNDISANKIFTLTAGDGENTVTKSISFQFMNKVYWGVDTDKETYNDAFILGLAGSKLATSPKGNYNFTAGTGQYCYFAVPTGMNLSVKVNGFDTDLDTVVASRSFTNASGYTTTYKILRLHQPSLGTLTAVVS